MKKLMKRLLAVVAAMTMVFAMAIPAMAAGETDGKITIKNTVANEKYDVYKIFDATTGTKTSFDATATTADSRNAAYTYTATGTTENPDAFLTALQGNNSPFTLTQQGDSNTYNVELKDEKNANDVVRFLNGQLENISSKKIGETHTASQKSTGSQEGNDIEITGLSYGYYYITTTTGSAVTINSAVNEVTVEDKNSVPSIDKKQSVDVDGEKEYTDDTKTASIGDTVYYEITVNAGKTNNNSYTVTDTLSNGLTLKHGGTPDAISNLSVQKFIKGTGEGSDVPVHSDANAGYTVSNITDRGFKIVFDANYVKTLNGANGTDASDTIVIKYSAVVNSNAVIAGDGNTNIANLEYSNQPTVEDKTTIKTYHFDLVKTKGLDSGNYEVLNGAKFQLFKGNEVYGEGNEDQATVANGASAIHFKKTTVAASSTDTNRSVVTTYTVTTEPVNEQNNVVDTIEAGNVRIIGLGNGTYALKETTAPDGYNKLTYIKKVVVNNANNDATVLAATQNASAKYISGGVQVINNAGTLLPSTGGRGTTIFYVLGAALVIAAGVVLVTRRRLSK